MHGIGLLRYFLWVGALTALAACTAPKSANNAQKAHPPPPAAEARVSSPAPSTEGFLDMAAIFEELEAQLGGRLGVYALDTGSGRTWSYRAGERFAMASTFKWALAAAILEKVDTEALSVDKQLKFTKTDLQQYAPYCREHLADGAASIEALTEAAVTLSDNTAANLLLKELGGPSALTAFIRSHGDGVTRLDRNEPTLNSNALGDERDTTSPRAMIGLMQRLLVEDGLQPHSQKRLRGWLRATKTGMNRMRTGVPSNWLFGSKTGSGGRNAINEVAMVEPPGKPPILIAIYTSGSSTSFEHLEATIAEVARRVIRDR